MWNLQCEIIYIDTKTEKDIHLAGTRSSIFHQTVVNSHPIELQMELPDP